MRSRASLDPQVPAQPAGRRAGRLAAAVGAALLLLTPAASAVAQSTAAPPPAAAAATEVPRLEAETARLRAQLDRVNAEIATLKRSPRNVADDYRLRQRMADAEALARRLTDTEAQLRRHKGTPAAPAPARALPATPVVAAPGDGPVELEAKADLLSDQARRLAAEADGLARVAGQIRGKQTLRRRAAGLERDPFAGVEGSKRSLVFGAPRAPGGASSPTAGGPERVPVGDTKNNVTPGPITGTPPGSPPRAGAPTPPPTPPPPMGGSAPGMGTPNPGLAPPGGMPNPTTTTPPAGPPPAPTTAVSVQARTLLDPATLAEIQRLEKSGKPLSDADALERAAAALKQRAQALEAQSKAMRTRARP